MAEYPPTVSDIERATIIQDRYDISFWDAMVIRSACCLGCKIVWSEDLNPGQTYEGVTVINPFVQD